MPYSNAEALDMISVLGECDNQFRAAARLWRERYPERASHSYKVFSRLINRIANKGIIQPCHNKGRQIRRPVRNERSAEILASAQLNPCDSLRRRERDSGIGRSTIHRILHDQKLHPYRMTLHQTLTNHDFRLRLEFCDWIRQQPRNFHQAILFSDECTFKSDVSVNTWNHRYWAQENPHWLREIDHQHVWKVNVWCGIIGRHIVGPFFFEENLNGVRYANFIRNDLPRLLENIPIQLRLDMFFQQDGCPAHTARVARRRLNEMFPDKWIGKHGPYNWPPRSPDLTVLDYYLWGRVKDVVYRERPTTREDMIRRIRDCILSLDEDEILRAIDNFERRVLACIEENGAHFEHKI